MEPDFLRNTRASYDAVAVSYAEWLRHELAAKPLDRAILAAFAEVARAVGAAGAAGAGGAGGATGATGSSPLVATPCWPSRSATGRAT